MKKRYLLPLILLLLLSAVIPACAQEAASITSQCTFVRNGKYNRSPEIQDGKYGTYCKLRKRDALEISADGQEIGGLFLQWYDHPSLLEIQVPQGDDWKAVTTIGTHLTDWVALPEGTTRCRLYNVDNSQAFLAEVTVYGRGEKPAEAHSWTDLDKADMMVVAAHPDDELLWLGGLLPTYAGQRNLKVQVVYLVRSTPLRRLELLDGLWHCGVTAYPDTLGLSDAFTNTLDKQYKAWNRDRLLEKLVAMLRKYRPEVVVTHDINGEYGHGAHQVAADSSILTVASAADAAQYPESAQTDGPWQVKKLYLHLWEGDGVTKMDWKQPLSAFGGKTGLTVATEALEYHRSQRKRDWEMTDGGRYDNALFGLYASVVGQDVDMDDLMEHIE